MSNSKPIIVIFGVTGRQGSTTADALLKYYPDRFQLRGITRNSNSATSSAWTAKGVEIVQADLEDAESVRNAIKGVYGVFFFQTLELNERRYEIEMNQARTVGEICKDAQIQHLVYSTTSDTQVPEAQHVPIIRNKTLIENMFRHELKLPTTFIKPPSFMENFLPSPAGRYNTIGDNEVSTFHPAECKIPLVACSDIGKAAAVAFANEKNSIGNDIIIISDYLNGNEIAEICTKVYGKPITYKLNPGLPQVMARIPDFGIMFQYRIERLITTDFTDETAKTAQFLESVGGVTSFETWLRQNAIAVLSNPN